MIHPTPGLQGSSPAGEPRSRGAQQSGIPYSPFLKKVVYRRRLKTSWLKLLRNQKHRNGCLVLTTVSAVEATHTCLQPAKLGPNRVLLDPRKRNWPCRCTCQLPDCGLPLWAPRTTDSAHLIFIFSHLPQRGPIDTCVRPQHRSDYTSERLNHPPIHPSHHPPPPYEPPFNTKSLQSSITDVPIPRSDAIYTLRRSNLPRDKSKGRP
jgi:hypothetical protein